MDEIIILNIKLQKGSGCGSVGRAVSSGTRGPLFKSIHWQNLYWTLFTVNFKEKKKTKEKEARNGPLKNPPKYKNKNTLPLKI